MADWGDGVSASCIVVQLSVSAGNGWPHNALRHHWLMPISCHFRDCKALLVTSLTHVSGAIASVLTFKDIAGAPYTKLNKKRQKRRQSVVAVRQQLYPQLVQQLFLSSDK